jgi:hypothetical protein
VSNAYFVATRFLTAKVWDNPEKLVSEYRSALQSFRDEFVAVSQERDPTRPYFGFMRSLVKVINTGRPLAEWVIQTRSIPSGKSKSVEMAARLLGKTRYVPKDIFSWYEKNMMRLTLLLEAASWPDRDSGEGTELEMATVGPFKIHNTIGASTKQFTDILGLVESAVRSLGTTLDFKKVLYGDVFIVGQLRQSKTLAWYSVNDDDVYVRSMAKKGFNDLQSLIHELGHRFWYRFMSREQKQNTVIVYQKLKYTASPAKLPRLGEPLPVPLKSGEHPTVIGYDGLRYQLSSGGYVKVNDIRKILNQQALIGSFPTLYSAKNYEEFFAECFSLFTLGKLKPDLAGQFESALKE